MIKKEVKHVEIPLRLWIAEGGDGKRIELGCLNEFRSSITEEQHKTLYNRLKMILEKNGKWVNDVDLANKAKENIND